MKQTNYEMQLYSNTVDGDPNQVSININNPGAGTLGEVTDIHMKFQREEGDNNTIDFEIVLERTEALELAEFIQFLYS